MTTPMNPNGIPAVFRYGAARLRILSREGRPDVAEIYVSEFEGRDASHIEFVDGLDTNYVRNKKWIINISTQFGCPIACLFCDAGGEYHGNLSVDEMLAQALYIASRHPELVTTCEKLKIHFARMGEPALNDSVPEAIMRLPVLFGNPNLWCCVPTIAPEGCDDWFERLREVKNAYFRGRFQLQFSINSTSEEDRAKLMPARLWSLEKIARYGEHFYHPGDRRIVLNFALADGIAFKTEIIKRHFDPAVFAAKLTPINPTRRGNQAGLKTILRDSRKEAGIGTACEALSPSGYHVIVSVGDGREDEIGSNCGQAVLRLNERWPDGSALAFRPPPLIQPK